ncbi:MAG: hypothetical protein KDJ88_19915 [Bauldia sp.]|nr:hypothetical protein [Bauldia sp.]
MRCPVCGSKAKLIERKGFDGLSFRCPVDGDFDVARSAEKKLRKLDDHDRVKALSRAIKKAKVDKRPCITEARL